MKTFLEYIDKKHLMETTNDHEKFLQNCQTNQTYKKAKKIVEKYGYKLSPGAHINEYKRIEDFIIINDKTNYKPDIYCDGSGKFSFQTIAYGKLSFDHYQKFVEASTNAYNMCKELNKLDLYTLYQIKSPYFD